MGSKAKSSSIVLLPSAARTATVNTDGTYYPEEFDELQIYLNVTAASGTTPTLDVKYQLSPDDGANWYDYGTAFTQVTAAAKQIIKIATNTGRLGRCVCTIGGTTPSFTFEIRMEGNKIGGAG